MTILLPKKVDPSSRDTLDGGLTEVVGIGFHRQPVDANSGSGEWRVESGELIVFGIRIVAGHLEDLVGDEVFPRAVAFNDGGHHVLRNVFVVGQKLLGVLGQAVTSIAEAGVVVMGADAGVKTDAVDDGLGVEALHLGVGVEFVEVADAQGQIGVGEELHGLSLFHANEKNSDVLFK